MGYGVPMRSHDAHDSHPSVVFSEKMVAIISKSISSPSNHFKRACVPEKRHTSVPENVIRRRPISVHEAESWQASKYNLPIEEARRNKTPLAPLVPRKCDRKYASNVNKSEQAPLGDRQERLEPSIDQ